MRKILRSILSISFRILIFLNSGIFLYAQDDINKITIRSIPAGGCVYMLEGENGFGGGNVAASIGKDGILLVDDMFKLVTPKVISALKKINDSAVIRIVVNSHFHADHIEGNFVLSNSAVIIAQENVYKRLNAVGSWASAKALPCITFNDKMSIHLNGEEIEIFHLPNGHTDNDVFVYFKTSKVIHMGDTYFNGMFPAVYTEGGGDIRQLIKNLDTVIAHIPSDAKVIPGHGSLATKQDLVSYVMMLKETTSIVEAAIKAGKTAKQLLDQKALAKYDALGNGGAQTTAQYLAMLYKLLM